MLQKVVAVVRREAMLGALGHLVHSQVFVPAIMDERQHGKNQSSHCHEHIIHDGIHKFPQIPAAPVSPCAKLEMRPRLMTSQVTDVR